MVRLVAELHAGGHDVPDFAHILASRVARCDVLGEVVERNVVVGHLLRAVSALDRAQGARDTRWQHHAVRGRYRWPGCRAIVIAGTFAGRYILREEIDGHPLGVGQEGPQLLRESDLHARRRNRGSLSRSGRVWPMSRARRDDEPDTTHALPVDVTRLLIPDE